MKLETIRTIPTFVLFVALSAKWPVRAQDAKTPYPSMAPLDQYLMERDAEIALARSAAPESISRDAEVMVLGRHGYETAVKGKNGFVCIVERSWTAGIDPSRVLESQTAGPDLPKPAGRADPTFHSRSRRPSWFWPDEQKTQMADGIKSLSTRRNCRRRNPARCVTCCQSNRT